MPTRRPRRRRHGAGAKQGWRGGRVPSGVEEARHPRPRALLTTQRARTRGRQRLPGRRAGEGLRRPWAGEGETPRAAGRPWDGAPPPAAGRARLQREGQQGQPRTAQGGGVGAARRAEGRARAARGREQGRP